MPYTLVVVDMQAEFDAAYDPKVIVGVTKEIIQAIKTKSPVLFLEYKNCGPHTPRSARSRQGLPT